jgi:predicted HTH transcriptional regulator
LEQALKFIDEHTFHPFRVVGLNNVRLDEYPTAALREALVNAVAHRSYDDASRKIFVRLFRDRIEVASPGYAPKPLTLARLRRGSYRPCSRNPLIAQALATLAVMEQRGTGFARMREAMLDHGLDEPKIEQQDGFFVVTLPGPAGNYDRIKTPAAATGLITWRSRRNSTSARKDHDRGAASWIRDQWLVPETIQSDHDTANRDLLRLVKLGLLRRIGADGPPVLSLAPKPLIFR